ncbi:glutamate--cysteine ligase [[Candida] jaroonii]|uniref:Glutamate--cysteine ligase n=1 Tax=[Candida] jaroonii TaxID=467808 RepID=A0ACA9Y833_9ASCO|nr:glutamate--cysteine ligase [[Candida] jaroonii]
MGLLSLGTPLDWHQSKKHNQHVRNNGIEQLINIFNQHGDRDDDKFYWGDEVEYMLVHIDDDSQKATLSIDKDYILDDLNDSTLPLYKEVVDKNVSFHPEYGRYMIEATPLKPFNGDDIYEYVYIEENMINRRQISQDQLPSNIKPLTITSFPRLGCEESTNPVAKPVGPASQSLFLPDEIINRHARFPTLTANIRKRRGCKVCINLPIYPDINTKLLDDSIPSRDLFDSDKEYLYASKPGHIYLDSMGFGMGASCLQMTMQLKNISEARYVYDMLAPITPLFLSLSAAAPMFKGFLVNQDVRWNVISGAVDDRTFIEKNIDPYPDYDYFGGLDVDDQTKLLFKKSGGHRGIDGDRVINDTGDTAIKTADGKNIQKIPKSRYASIDNYLSNSTEKYNDIYSPLNDGVYQKLKKNGFDPVLAQHFSHLFIRDPLVIFSERVDQDNTLDNDHFENIQSTNWQTLRFKPPSLYGKVDCQGKHIDLSEKPGWRVEFRPTEIQLTDFENAAYSSFIILLSRAIAKFKPNFYIPISKIDDNMDTAHKVDSVLKDKFWFKNFTHWELDAQEFMSFDLSWFDRYINKGNDLNTYQNGYMDKPVTDIGCKSTADDHPCLNSTCKYTINEIINGNNNFPGLIRLVIKFIATDLVPKNQVHCNSKTLAAKLLRLQYYLTLISKRASGKTPTIANFVRSKVLKSSLYHQDSKISSELNYEIIKMTEIITNLDFDNHKDLLYEYFGPKVANYLEKNPVLNLDL